MKALITGIGGFAGSHLADYILAHHNVELSGILRDGERDDNIHHHGNAIRLFTGDIVDFQSVFTVVKEIKPDIIFHLAAQAFVPSSFEHTAETFKINVIGAINILEATKACDYSPRIVMVTSGEIYGETAGLPVVHTEHSIPRPVNPYAASKTSIDYIAQTYNTFEGLDVVIARPFNHTGPRQKPSFVCSSLGRQIAAIKKNNLSPKLVVGNIKPKRDFSDVRDIVRAYWLISQIKKEKQFCYNVCSGNIFSIEEVINLYQQISGITLTLEVDPKRLRGYDINLLAGNATLVRERTGWKPMVEFRRTLEDTLDYWLGRI